MVIFVCPSNLTTRQKQIPLQLKKIYLYGFNFTKLRYTIGIRKVLKLQTSVCESSNPGQEWYFRKWQVGVDDSYIIDFHPMVRSDAYLHRLGFTTVTWYIMEIIDLKKKNRKKEIFFTFISCVSNVIFLWLNRIVAKFLK